MVDRSEIKLILEASGKDGTNSSDAQSNAATDNESEHRSEGGESFTATNNEVSNAINAVTKKVRIFKLMPSNSIIKRPTLKSLSLELS